VGGERIVAHGEGVEGALDPVADGLRPVLRHRVAKAERRSQRAAAAVGWHAALPGGPAPFECELKVRTT